MKMENASLCVTVRKLPSQFDQMSRQLLQLTASGKMSELYFYIFKDNRTK